MAHNSTENLIGSDSSTSTDELNNDGHSRSVEKVAKKIFHKRKTAFGANSVTSPSSSVTSSPQQHPIIVVGTADVHHQAGLSPPKPFPRKQMMTTPGVDSITSNRKVFTNVDDIVEMSVSGDSESNNSEKKAKHVTNREEMELVELKSQSGSSGAHSDRTEDPKMFFARSRKNTIVTNIDEISTKSSGRTIKSLRSEGKSQQELKPMPKPRQHVQHQCEIVHEKSSRKRVETPEKQQSISELSHSQRSESLNSDSETLTETEFSKNKKLRAQKSDRELDPETRQQDDVIERLVGIYVHFSSELKFDYNVHRPIVRCSIIDTTTGQLIVPNGKINGKSPTKASDTKNTIQPVVTKGCRFTSSSMFKCEWEQLLMINENIKQLMHGNVVIFFEILDTPSIESETLLHKLSRTTNEWHYVCWGFLKVGDGINTSNVCNYIAINDDICCGSVH